MAPPGAIVPLLGLATLTNTSGTVTTAYDHADHLSVRLMTDGTPGSSTYGQMIGQQGSDPWGEAWYSGNATTEFLYTTYQRDQESGLDYAMARYYDSSEGRFCSADPVGGSADDPQSWNRYAYARNDPVNIIDPSGKFWGFLIGLIIKLFGWIFSALANLGSALGAVGAGAGAGGGAQFGVVSVYIDGQLVSGGIDIWTTADAVVGGVGGGISAAGLATGLHPPGGPGIGPGGPTPGHTAPQQPQQVGNKSSLNCIQNALDNRLGTQFQQSQNTSTPERGGHINGTFESYVPTSTATDISGKITGASFPQSVYPGTRFPGGLHIPTGKAIVTPDESGGMALIEVTGHIDNFFPHGFDVGSYLGHFFDDIVWGHIKQGFGGNIDKQCAAAR
jgi:RHS repeat-associated protein